MAKEDTALDSMNTYWTNRDLDWFEQWVGPLIPSPESLGIPWVSGKLGMSVEGGRWLGWRSNHTPAR